MYVSPLAVSLVDVPPGGGYNFIYSTRDGGLVYFSDTVNYNTASNPSYFCGIIPLSSFAGTGTTPPTLAEIELQLTNAIRANPVTNQILSPKANGSLPPANFAPDIRNDTTRGSINFDPLTPVWSNAQVTVSGGTEDSLAASGQFNVVDLNTLDVVRAAVDAVTPVWTQRVGTVAIPTPLSNASLLAMLDIRDSYGNRNPIALAADPFLGSTLKWNFNQNDPGVINPFGTSNSFDWLAAGESVALTYTIKVMDNGATSQPPLSDSQQVVITINGVNDGPIANADVNGTDLVTEAGVKPVNTAFPGDSSATGNLLSNDTDLDLTDTKTVTTTGTFTGNYGSVIIGANGVWTYTLNNADPDTNALAQNSIVTDVFAYTMQDNNGASSSSTLTITIKGTNDVPVITNAAAARAGTVIEAGNLDNGTVVPGISTISGTLSASDVDTAATRTWSIQGTPSTTYGSLGVNAASGVWTYTLNNSLAATQALKEGASVTQTYTVRVTDDFGAYVNQTVTITIKGTNDAAVIGGTTDGTVTEAGGVNNTTLGTPTATGTLTCTDVDNTPNSFQEVSVVSTTSGYGTYAVTTGGVWTYTLNNNNTTVQDLNVGGSTTDTFSVSTADGTTQVVTVTINGVNDAAVIGGTTDGTVTEAGGVNNTTLGTPTATGTLTCTDVDNTPNSFQAVSVVSTTSGYGTYAVTTGGLWTYTLDNNNTTVQDLNVGGSTTDTFSVSTADGTTQVVTVTINGVNDAAVIGGTTDGTVTEAGGANPGTPTATGTLTCTDVDNTPNSFQVVSGTAGYGSYTVTTGGLWTYNLDNTNGTVQALNSGQSTTDTFSVSTDDGTTQVVTVTINGTDDTNYTNLSFESGFSGWNTTGNTAVQQSTNAVGSNNLVSPNVGSGSFFAALSTDPIIGSSNPSDSDIEFFLGISTGTLDLLTGVDATNGSAIQTTIYLTAGQTLSFDYRFATSDYLTPTIQYNDFAFYSVAPSTAKVLADVFSAGSYTGDTGWNKATYTATSAGDYVVGFGVMNGVDTVVPSQLFVDNLLIT